jgi:hypothetical protein
MTDSAPMAIIEWVDRVTEESSEEATPAADAVVEVAAEEKSAKK